MDARPRVTDGSESLPTARAPMLVACFRVGGRFRVFSVLPNTMTIITMLADDARAVALHRRPHVRAQVPKDAPYACGQHQREKNEVK